MAQELQAFLSLPVGVVIAILVGGLVLLWREQRRDAAECKEELTALRAQVTAMARDLNRVIGELHARQ